MCGLADVQMTDGKQVHAKAKSLKEEKEALTDSADCTEASQRLANTRHEPEGLLR